jgi:hypothetical protein
MLVSDREGESVPRGTYKMTRKKKLIFFTPVKDVRICYRSVVIFTNRVPLAIHDKFLPAFTSEI